MYRFVIWCILCPLGPFSLARSHILLDCFDNDLKNNLKNKAWDLEHNAGSSE